jgi:hypothetical protein
MQLCKSSLILLVLILIFIDRNLLEESVSIAENLAEAQGYLARSCIKLSQIYGRLGNLERQKRYVEEAETIRKTLYSQGNLPEISAEEYDSLVLWMLW